MSKSFEAKFRSKCRDCGESIQTGQSVHFNDQNSVVHDNCLADYVGDNLEITTPVCKECNMVTPCWC